MECQRHGFQWEIDIKRNVFGISEEEDKLSYTAKWDIPKELNRIDDGVNISIKTTGSDTVCMGDAIRIYEQNPGDINTCIVIFYKQRGEQKVLTRIVEWVLNDLKALFGNVTLQEVRELQQAVVSFPKNKRLSDVPEYKQKLTDMANILNAKSGAIKFNRKIDSGSQRRLQCSISGFDAFITKNSHLVAYDTPNPILRDVEITRSILSGPRVFKCDEVCGE